MNPKVSVIIASYNHEPYVEHAVRSVMEQTGVDFELIVIDDGSKDRSPKILKRLSDELGFTYVHRPNKGAVATYSEALSMARGRYVCSFSSDDIMPPDRLKKQSDFLDVHPDAVACFGQVIPFFEGEMRIAAGFNCVMVGSVEGSADADFSRAALRGLSKVDKNEKTSCPASCLEK